MTKITEYRAIKLEIFADPASNAWFYCFPFHWVIYRPSHGYPTYSDAREAGEDHIDQVFKEAAVEL